MSSEEHWDISRKFIEQAVSDCVDAASQAIGTLAEHRGWKYDTHTDMFRVARRIAEETSRREIRVLFQVALISPYNFDEGWVDNEGVEFDIEAVKKLLTMLEGIY